MQHSQIQDAVFNPKVRLHRLVFPADVQQTVLIKEETPDILRPGVDQQEPDTLNMKEEEEDPWASLETEQLYVKKETDDTRLALTAVPLKSEDDEEKPLFLQLHQHQVEDGAPPSSSSAGVSSTTFQSEQKSISCDDCGKTFHRKHTLNIHMRIHTGEKLFLCDVCGRRFGVKSSLKAHIGIHTGQKPFVCSCCGHRYRQKSILDRHMVIHTGQRLFVCGHCGQRFGHKSTLDRHMRIHTGQIPYVCDLCGQRFRYKSHLNRHVRIHTGQRPYVCDLCGQRFRYKSPLNNHMRIHTGQKSSLSVNNKSVPKDT